MIRINTLVAAGTLAALVGAAAIHSQGRSVEWRYFGGDKAFTRYSSAEP